MDEQEENGDQENIKNNFISIYYIINIILVRSEFKNK